MKRDDALLLDMLLAARDTQESVTGMSEADFLASRLHQNPVVRSLEIIGEAAGRLSPELRGNHPDIPWSDMVGMRHRLIHDDGDVRLGMVCNVVNDHFPTLIETIGPLVPPASATDPDAGV